MTTPFSRSGFRSAGFWSAWPGRTASAWRSSRRSTGRSCAGQQRLSAEGHVPLMPRPLPRLFFPVEKKAASGPGHGMDIDAWARRGVFGMRSDGDGGRQPHLCGLEAELAGPHPARASRPELALAEVLQRPPRGRRGRGSSSASKRYVFPGRPMNRLWPRAVRISITRPVWSAN
jgi:hypothetical protein